MQNGSRYILLNCINWNTEALNTLPLDSATEFTYFVLPVGAEGDLLGTSAEQERRFVADVHHANKKATFSVAGGSQDVTDITHAITRNRAKLVQNIADHLAEYEYDGVTLDIENTLLDPDVMADFVNDVRMKLDSMRLGLILGMYVQPYQLHTVHAKLDQAISSLDWVSPMIYDFRYTMDELKELTFAWLPNVGNNPKKLLCGIAVNYETGLDAQQFGEVLEWVDEVGLKGVGIWQNALYTEPWREVCRSKWP